MPRLLLTTDAVGGVWQYALDLARGLQARGWGVTLAVLGPPPTPAQRAAFPLVETGLALDWLAAGPDALAASAAALAALADAHDLALLHAPALIGTVPWPVPVASVVHSCLRTWWDAVRGGPIDPDFAWRVDATTAGLRRAAGVAAPTRSFAETVRRAYGLAEVTVLHNGRDPVPLPALPRDPAVLTVGRLWDDGKNVAVLHRAAPLLHAPIRAAGPRRGPNGAEIALPALHWLGVLDEAGLAAALAGASVFAAPSVYEPFGLAVLEAAGAGLSLVLADIGPFRELWDGVARFVPPHDLAAWAAALRDALAAPLDASARAARYSSAASIAATEDWLRGLLAGPLPPGRA